MSKITKVLVGLSLSAIFSTTTQSQPLNWDKTCKELGAFAELIAEHRTKGRSYQEALEDSLPVIQAVKDRLTAEEIAKRVFASKNSAEQDANNTFKTCMELSQNKIPGLIKPQDKINQPKVLEPEKTPQAPPITQQAEIPKAPIIPEKNIVPPQQQQAIIPPVLQPQQVEKPKTNADVVGKQPQGPDSLSDLKPIPLDVGANKIDVFTQDGRAGIITLSWRNEDNGRGRDAFLTTVQSKDRQSWNKVDILPATDVVMDGAVTDDPSHDHDMLRSVRFAFGKFKGQDSTLLIITDRLKENTSNATTTYYEVYRLEQIGERDVFIRIVQRTLKEKYCNADLALSEASGMPLRATYKGPRDASGNITPKGCNQ